jgi:hypothetical protein
MLEKAIISTQMSIDHKSRLLEQQGPGTLFSKQLIEDIKILKYILGVLNATTTISNPCSGNFHCR